VAPGQTGPIQVALLGNQNLDVNQVDTTSLRLHGAHALNTVIGDVDGDGQSDLLVTFDMARMKLGPQTAKLRLTGWLKNSQAFFAEDNIRVVSSMAGEAAACR
jgi:autotransporter translocation and assembly factor TamB